MDSLCCEKLINQVAAVIGDYVTSSKSGSLLDEYGKFKYKRQRVLNCLPV
jgi:hypothetical protein